MGGSPDPLTRPTEGLLGWVASALAEPVAHRTTDDSLANDKHHTEGDDLFAQWESDPLQLLSFPDLGI